MWWKNIAGRLSRIETALERQREDLADLRDDLEAAHVLSARFWMPIDRLPTAAESKAHKGAIDLAQLAAAVNALLDARGLAVEYQKAGWRVVEKKEPDAEA